MAGKNLTVPELGPLEFELLKILWKNSPATAGEVLEVQNRKSQRKLKYTTVMTLLTRLVEKGVLSVDRSRQPFQFSPRVGKEQLLTQRLREFVEIFFEGKTVDLAVRLVEDAPLSEESIIRLEELLQRQRQFQPDEEARN